MKKKEDREEEVPITNLHFPISRDLGDNHNHLLFQQPGNC